MADGPLAGRRVIDTATLFDRPLAATLLGDLGAAVTKVEHGDELDDPVSSWIGASAIPGVVAAFERAATAVGAVYDPRGVLADPPYDAIGTVTTIDDDELAPVKMQNVSLRMSESPGPIRCAGRPRGADTDAFLSEPGYTDDEIAGLRVRGAA